MYLIYKRVAESLFRSSLFSFFLQKFTPESPVAESMTLPEERHRSQMPFALTSHLTPLPKWQVTSYQ